MSGNPGRGCGKKKEDAFYLEGGAPSAKGNLWAWTWALGGHDASAPIVLPPRQVVGVNPAACLTTGTLVKADDQYEPAEWDAPTYYRLLDSTKRIGVGDHVGADNYTAVSFAKETMEYGLSRRVPRNVAALFAELIRKHGAIPSMMTHSRIPVFSTEAEMNVALELALDIWPEMENDLHKCATWMVKDWGMYCSIRRNQYNGKRSAMIPILNVVGGLDKDWESHKGNPKWQAARETYDKFFYHEQVFGMAWILQVTYTVPENGKVDESLFNIPGLRFLDLKKEEYLN